VEDNELFQKIIQEKSEVSGRLLSGIPVGPHGQKVKAA
jgi:hypothetical protein